MSRRSSLVFAFLKAFPASKMPGKSWKNLRNSAIAEINPWGEVFSSFLFESDLELLFFAGSLFSIGAAICWLLEAAFAYDRLAFAFFEVKVFWATLFLFSVAAPFFVFIFGKAGQLRQFAVWPSASQLIQWGVSRRSLIGHSPVRCSFEHFRHLGLIKQFTEL
ncbi:hypothetical protein TNCV_1517101 [Trichonephila clavipes]|nr:hypothetical protein TNCV_1517101 [Trichonephila clavipes]